MWRDVVVCIHITHFTGFSFASFLLCTVPGHQSKPSASITFSHWSTKRLPPVSLRWLLALRISSVTGTRLSLGSIFVTQPFGNAGLPILHRSRRGSALWKWLRNIPEALRPQDAAPPILLLLPPLGCYANRGDMQIENSVWCYHGNALYRMTQGCKIALMLRHRRPLMHLQSVSARSRFTAADRLRLSRLHLLFKSGPSLA